MDIQVSRSQLGLNMKFLFFGDAAVIRPLLDAAPALSEVSTLRHTGVSVRMDAKPSQALRVGRRTSSMWLAIEAVKKNEADVAISAGNTGALMAMARFNLKMIEGRSEERRVGKECRL